MTGSKTETTIAPKTDAPSRLWVVPTLVIIPMSSSEAVKHGVGPDGGTSS